MTRGRNKPRKRIKNEQVSNSQYPTCPNCHQSSDNGYWFFNRPRIRGGRIRARNGRWGRHGHTLRLSDKYWKIQRRPRQYEQMGRTWVVCTHPFHTAHRPKYIPPTRKSRR